MNRQSPEPFEENNDSPRHVAKRGETWGWLADTLESLRSTIARRVGNPVVSSFILSWLIFNYEIWLTVIGDGSSIVKIRYIKKLVAAEGASLHLFWSPLLFSLVFPFVEVGLTGFGKLLDNWRKGLLLRIDQQQPVSAKDRAEFYAAIKKEVDVKNDELDRLLEVNRATREEFRVVVAHFQERIRQAAREAMSRRLSATSGRIYDDAMNAPTEWDSRGISIVELDGAVGPTFQELILTVVRGLRRYNSTFVTFDWFKRELKIDDAMLNQMITYLIGLGVVREEIIEGSAVFRVSMDSPSLQTLGAE